MENGFSVSPDVKVIAVCISERKGTMKHPVESVILKPEHGIVGDCVMPREGIFAIVLNCGTIRPGDRITLLTEAET